MHTRRKFLEQSGLLFGIGLLDPLRFIPVLEDQTKFTNPHLYFSSADLSFMKKNLKRPLFETFWQETLKADIQSDKKFLEYEIKFNNQIRHLLRADQILQRAAFVFAMTGNETHGELAKLAVRKILEFKKWDYFLEAGKYVIGLQRAPLTVKSLILAYSYLNDYLPPAEKEEILKQLPGKGIEPCYRSLYGMLHPEKVVGWGFDPESSFYEVRDMKNWPVILRHTNLRAVPLSALGLGTLFLGDRSPRASEWMKVVKESFDDFSTTYKPDGSYPEGTSYCQYASQELVIFLNALYRERRKDWYKRINWPGVMDFFLMTTMPSTTHPEGHVNFGDGGGGFSSDIGFWVAKMYQDGEAQFAAKGYSQRHTPFSLLWFNPEAPAKRPAGKWFYRRFDIGWVVVTAGFKAKNFLLALRSGGPANHEHADRNSIILKCYSENLFVDNWHPPYNHLNPAWILRTSPAHNTVLINGKGHEYVNGLEGTNASLARAEVVREKITKDYAIVSSDAAPAYRLVIKNVKNVMRTFLAVPELKFLVVVDTLKMEQGKAAFQARWFIDNEDGEGKIELNGSRFVFIRPQALLMGVCAGDHGVKLTQSTFPVPKKFGVFPYMDVSAGRKGQRITLITAAAALQKGSAPAGLSIRPVESGWEVTGKISGKEIRVTVSTQTLIPVLSVKSA